MSKKISIKSRLREQRRLYIDSVGVTGGYPDEFREWVRKDREESPDEYGHYYEELLDNAMASVWAEKPRPMPLFRIAGVALPEDLTYADRTKPGGFGTVGHDHANTGQLREAAILVMRKGAEAVRRGEDLMGVADVAFDRAKGNPLVLLKKVLDKSTP